MAERKRSVRLKDVAAHAGVSVATVSAVMRGLHDGSVRVGPETRERVQNSIRELGYRPNRAAQALRTRRSGLVGIVVPDITNPLFPQFVRAGQQRAEVDGVHAMVWDSCGEASRERAAIAALLDHQVDGVVLVTEHLGIEDLAPLLDAGVPIGATDARLADPRVDLVSEDLHAGAFAATSHLIEAGHRRLAHIAGDRTTTAGTIREQGFRDALEANEIGVDEQLIVGGDTFERDAGYTALTHLVELDDPPTAVLTSNDVLAIGALKACADRGIVVPDEIALIGIDNTPEADVAHPGLTTMDVHPHEVASKLTDIVIRRLNGTLTAPARREIVTPTLVARQSV